MDFKRQIEVLFNNLGDVKKLVFLAGAGISASAGYPLWEAGTKFALDEAKKKGLTRGTTLYGEEKLKAGLFYDVFDILQRELTEPAFYELAVSAFGGVHPPSEIHHMLVRIDCRGIITTNFDECLLTACVQERGYPPINEIQYAMATDKFFVVKPHGTILTPRTMVLSSSDWQKVENNSAYKDLLSQTVSNSQVLFLGYSMRDPDFNRLWDRILRERIFRATAVCCCAEGSLPDARREELRVRNVQVIEFPDDGSFGFVADVLRAILKEQQEASPRAVARKTEGVPHELERYLALCMQFSPTQKGGMVLVAKALALEVCSQSKVDAIASEDVLVHVFATLGQDSQAVRNAALTALRELDSSGFVVLEGETLRLNRGPLNRVAAEVKNLADAEQRWVREAVHEQQRALGVSFDSSDEGRLVLILDRVLAEMGRAVAELVLFNRSPRDESQRIDSAVDEFCTSTDCRDRKELYARTVKRMLFEPADKEEDVLFKKLQAYFIASAYLMNPTSEKLLAQYAHDHKVYLDSSIILPALASGHPSNKIYRNLLHRTSSLGMRLRATMDMLNEVWANIRSAISAFQEFSRTETPLLDVLEAYVSVQGPGNGNVFIEGFLSRLRLDAKHTPMDYMLAILGSDPLRVREQDVVRTVSETFGIESDSLKAEEVASARIDPIAASIEHLRKFGGRFKSRLLCEHEARQFYLIHLRREQNPELSSKIWFVTTDRFIVELQRLERDHYPLPIAYNPRTWFQYLDLLDVESRGSQHFSRLQPKMRFGVVCGDLGIEAIRAILHTQRDLLKKGVVTMRELAEAAVKEYHVQQSIAEYDRVAGSYRQDDDLKREARDRIRQQIGEATNQFVAMRKHELEQLKAEKQAAVDEAKLLKRKLAKEQHVTRVLRSERKPRRRKKGRR